VAGGLNYSSHRVEFPGLSVIEVLGTPASKQLRRPSSTRESIKLKLIIFYDPTPGNKAARAIAKMNTPVNPVSKRSMNQSCLSQPLRRLLFRVSIGALVASFGFFTPASSAEAVFSLYRSTDQGASWFKVGQGLPAKARINAVSMIGNTVVAGTDQGIYLSHDEGKNWQPSPDGVGSESRVLCLTVQARRIFAGTQKHGVLVSEDGGMTWQATNNRLGNLYVRSLLTVGTKLYAGMDDRGVYVSEDAGASWTNQRAGLPASPQVFDLADVNGEIFAALYSKGLYRWDAGSKSWVKSGAVVPLEIVAVGDSIVVGHNPGGIFVSEDRGTNWLDGNSGLPINAPTWTLAAGEDRVWLGTSGKVGHGSDDIGLFVSKDRGKSWIRSDAGLPPSSAAISLMVAEQFILAAVSSKQQPK
jgi:photosystem II stability/assembly factor-like uncharacterized protein